MDDPDDTPIDVSNLSFASLRGRADTAIVHAVRLLLEELKDAPAEPVAGFQSSI